MKNIFFLLLLMTTLTATAQNLIVKYSFSQCDDDTVFDESGNGYDGVLYGGAHCSNNILIAGQTDSDCLSVPPEVLNGLGDFTISIKPRIRKYHHGSPTSMNSIFSTSNESCFDCFGLAYRNSDDMWLLSYNGVIYPFANGEAIHGELLLIRKDDTISFYHGNLLDLIIIDATPLNVSTFIVGEKEHCLGGCFLNKQSLDGGVNNLLVFDGSFFKEFNSEDSETSFEIFPNPVSSAFQLNYTLSASSPLTITDAFGRIAKQLMLDASSTNITISTDDLADGVYLVSLNDGDKRISRKLIVCK